MEGFEPSNVGARIQCLTTWRHPTITQQTGVKSGARTHDLQGHNLALCQLSYIHHFGVPKGIRTPDPRLRRAMLCPAELLAHKPLAGVAGFEPTNARVKVSCLTTWRHPNKNIPPALANGLWSG